MMAAHQRAAFPPMPLTLTQENLENHNTALLQQAIMAPADGYKWRKYGQKSVKGSDYPRNYYKCTFPGCGVKKYVEKQEEEGKVVDRVTYKGGEHTHDPSRITRLNAIDQTSFKQSVLSESLGHQEMIVKAETRHETLEITDPSSPSGTSTITTESPATIFPASPRLVVETTADVDHNDDGYSWRKYGQKNVKGAVGYAPRSYYRCTQEDCPVKKQVEQRGNSIFNTYEGTHNHLAPGWEEVNKKKKRKLGRTSLERSLIPRSLDGKLDKGMDSSGEMHDKVGDDGDMGSAKQYASTQEEAMAMVISETNHTNETRTLIPLQELQSESTGIPLGSSLP
jgi:hypothetical protein